MNSGIYSLIARDRKTNKFVILPIEELDNELIKYKVNISSIDKLTCHFKDEKSLAERLYNNGYIDFIDADIFIRYKHNDVFIFLEPIYKNYSKFSELITVSESTIEKDNKTFQQACDNFFLEFNKPNLRNYVLTSLKLNMKLKEHIKSLYEEKDLKNINFRKSEIMKDLTNYRTLRNLTFVINEYYNRELVRYYNMKNEMRKKCFLEKLFNEEEPVMDISVPINYKKEEPKNIEVSESNKYNDALISLKENDSPFGLVDLDDILSMSDEEQRSLGIDVDKINEYTNNGGEEKGKVKTLVKPGIPSENNKYEDESIYDTMDLDDILSMSEDDQRRYGIDVDGIKAYLNRARQK